jgi:uncharacterized protein YukE
MSNVHVDPQKLDAFATELRTMNEVVTKRMDELSNLVGKLGESWRDAQFGEFRTRMVKTKAHLQLFSVEAKRAIAQLQIDAEAARELQRLEMPDR